MPDVIDHPRTVPSRPWRAHGNGVLLPHHPTVDGRQFVPVVQYSSAGEQLKVYWGTEPTFADELDSRDRVTVLRAFACHDLLQGVKIWGVPEIMPVKGNPPPANRPTHSFDPLNFKPFAHYHAATDRLIIRWLPGRYVVSVPDDSDGHPMAFILSTDFGPEDPPGQKPWQLVGVSIDAISLAVPIGS